MKKGFNVIEGMVVIVLFGLAMIGIFIIAVNKQHESNGSVSTQIDQSRVQTKTEAVSTDRVFKVDGHEYVCHNNADFNYTSRTCYSDNSAPAQTFH